MTNYWNLCNSVGLPARLGRHCRHFLRLLDYRFEMAAIHTEEKITFEQKQMATQILAMSAVSYLSLDVVENVEIAIETVGTSDVNFPENYVSENFRKISRKISENFRKIRKNTENMGNLYFMLFVVGTL